MKYIRAVGTWALFAILAGLIGGCGASRQARSVDLNPILVNPSLYTRGEKGQALYRYENPDINFARYHKILIEPVLIAKDGELDDAALQNYEALANNAYVYVREEIEKDYEVVDTPQPDTVRFQMALIDADPSKPVRNFIGTFLPVGMTVSLVKYTATGKPTGVGEITGELLASDAMTGELLGAGYDRRVGGTAPQGIIDTWYNADQALRYWAKMCRYGLCKARGGTDCPKP